MKRKEPATKNQKYGAIILASIMLFSVLVILFNNPKTGSDNNVSTPAVENNSSTIPFSQIPGKQIHHQFNSIADGLNMSPDGVIGAEYVDLQKAAGTPMEQIFEDLKSRKFLYDADVTKLYVANYAEGRGFDYTRFRNRRSLLPLVQSHITATMFLQGQTALMIYGT